MATLDALNERFGRDAVGIASAAKKTRAARTRPGKNGARRGTPRGWMRSLWREHDRREAERRPVQATAFGGGFNWSTQRFD
jgi:hypothetical protein